MTQAKRSLKVFFIVHYNVKSLANKIELIEGESHDLYVLGDDALIS